MEFQVASDVDGTVESVHVAAGDQVAARQLLVVISSEEEKSAN
jgi:biotin carboxyl carrier protein